ncbi:MAG: hypothetical protein FGM34_08095, partial [Solirubrobacteraceae bacterium]|nr:hypothetical protein [Solirubrobacteraceae bacterium]
MAAPWLRSPPAPRSRPASALTWPCWPFPTNRASTAACARPSGDWPPLSDAAFGAPRLRLRDGPQLRARSVPVRWFTRVVLTELRVRNLLLIEEAELRPAAGLNVLTGETGAGKTVLAHALDLLLGGRPRSAVIRPGADEALVEGVFELDEAEREALSGILDGDEGEVVLARRVQASGRTRALVNGRTVTVGALREAAERLLAFYGQHEHRKLTVASSQLEILDHFCGDGQRARLDACAEAHRRVLDAQERLAELEELEGGRERELDILDFEIAEIEEAAPDPAAEEELLAA